MTTVTVKSRFKRFIKNYLKKISIGLIINFVIIFALCFFMNKTQLQSYVNCIFYVGGANLAFGFGSIFGGASMRGDLGYQYSRCSGSESQIKRIKEDLNSIEKSFSFTMFMAMLGGILLLISAALQLLV